MPGPLKVVAAVIVPPAKFPEASRDTNVLGVLVLVASDVTVNVTAPEPLYDPEPLNPTPDVASVKEFRLFPNTIPDIVDAASLDTAIAAEVLISALTIAFVSASLLFAIAADPLISPFTIVPSAIIVDVTVPESVVVTTVPELLVGNLIMPVAPEIPSNLTDVDAPVFNATPVAPKTFILKLPDPSRTTIVLGSASEF